MAGCQHYAGEYRLLTSSLMPVGPLPLPDPSYTTLPWLPTPLPHCHWRYRGWQPGLKL